MSGVALAFVYALFVWWFSTGIVLLLVLRARRTLTLSLIGSAVLFPVSLYWLARTASDAGVTGAYAAFTAAVFVWGTQELAFLTGFLTGPRPRPCPQDARGVSRALYAIGAILYHEIGLAVAGLAVAAVTYGQANQTGPLTFLVLWVMRISAKVNLFLGVPVLNDEIMPAHLTFLRSYFLRGPVNPVFPLTMAVASVAMAALVQKLFAPETDAAGQTSFMLLAALLALAMLEHGFMLIRLPVDALWRWSTRGQVQSCAANGNAPASSHRREQPRDIGDIERVVPTIP